MIPKPEDEAERLEALRKLELMDTEAEETWNRVVEVASLACGTPIALVTLLDETRQWFKARVGLDAPQTAREDAFCSYAIMDEGIMVVEDAQKDERFVDNPLVTGHPDIRFYAGAPIKSPQGKPLGTLCIIDTKPRELPEDHARILHLLAEQIGEILITRQMAIALRDAIMTPSQDSLNTVAHHLRTPMTPLMIGLRLLEGEELSDRARDTLDRMRRNLERLDLAVGATLKVLLGNQPDQG